MEITRIGQDDTMTSDPDPATDDNIRHEMVLYPMIESGALTTDGWMIVAKRDFSMAKLS